LQCGNRLRINILCGNCLTNVDFNIFYLFETNVQEKGII
jgi:hypothetical protein